MPAGQPNHRSVINNADIEWLQEIPDYIAHPIASELAEAEEFADEEVTAWLHSHIRAWSGVAGRRVKMLAEIAKNDDTIQHVTEMSAGRRGV